MRRYLVDTTPLAAFLNNKPEVVALLTPYLVPRELTTSVIIYREVIESFKSHPGYARRRAELRALLRLVQPLGLRYSVVERYADLRRQLRPPHGTGMIGDIDTLIAATALAHDLELITTDGDFARVPGLRVRLLDRTTFRPIVR